MHPLSMRDTESCLSGRKSHTRNVVYALRRTGGSNPSLSASRKLGRVDTANKGVEIYSLLFLYPIVCVVSLLTKEDYRIQKGVNDVNGLFVVATIRVFYLPRMPLAAERVLGGIAVGKAASQSLTFRTKKAQLDRLGFFIIAACLTL